jgi:hypothetical protein
MPNRNIGSKLKRFLLTDKSKSTAGLLNEKLGKSDMPLLVAVITPENTTGVCTLSTACAQLQHMFKINPNKITADLILYLFVQKWWNAFKPTYTSKGITYINYGF